MSKRSKARQIVVQMLFQVDLNPDVTGRTVRDMMDERLSEHAMRDFAWRLFAGVMEHRPQLDEQIQNVAENWKLSRMAGTDRAVLRLGAFELQHTDTPVRVVIDEALELAKKFGSRQSSPFVNGILDRLIPPERRSKDRPARSAALPAPETEPVLDPEELKALRESARQDAQPLTDSEPESTSSPQAEDD
jgi:N utilization substance protein B